MREGEGILRRGVESGQSQILLVSQTHTPEKKRSLVAVDITHTVLATTGMLKSTSLPYDVEEPHTTRPQCQLPHYLCCISDSLLYWTADAYALVTSHLPLSRPASLPVPQLGEQFHAPLSQDIVVPSNRAPAASCFSGEVC